MRNVCPRLEIDLDKIFHNASRLVSELQLNGISVMGVTKAFSGAPQIAHVMLQAGAISLGDSRIENIERMRNAGIDDRIILIRSPMISQIDRVVASADASFNTEIDVLRALSAAALKIGKVHEIILMIELGDLREGIMPDQLKSFLVEIEHLSGINLVGIGANLACRSGVSPDDKNMGQLSDLAQTIASSGSGLALVVSGGNSSNLKWVFGGGQTGRINNLRLGEAILLGREPLCRNIIAGLYADAIELVAEVIESKTKPSEPWGTIGQSTFNDAPSTTNGQPINQAILAIGRQDVDWSGLQAAVGMRVLGASSDHLIVDTGSQKLRVGENVRFNVNYSALLSAMTSPFVTKDYYRAAHTKSSRWADLRQAGAITGLRHSSAAP